MTMPYVLFCSLFFFTNFFFFLLLDDEDDDHHRCRLLITSSCPPPLPSNARRGWVVLFFKTPLDNNEYPPLACDCMSFLLVCLLSLTTNDNDGACPNPLAFGSESGWGFPTTTLHHSGCLLCLMTTPIPPLAEPGCTFFHSFYLSSLMADNVDLFILIATNDDEDHPRRQHPSVCAIPSQQVHQRQLTSGVHLRGILYAQTHMGFHIHGTLQTRTCEHGNPAPVQMGMGFCGYGHGLGNFCPRVTRAHHYPYP